MGCIPVVRPVAWSSIVCAPICKGCCIVRFDGLCTGCCNGKVDAPGVLVCRSKVFGVRDHRIPELSHVYNVFIIADEKLSGGRKAFVKEIYGSYDMRCMRVN